MLPSAGGTELLEKEVGHEKKTLVQYARVKIRPIQLRTKKGIKNNI